MKVQCYAIFDSCSGIYEKPFFATADDLVRREFQDVATSADHVMSNHPEHFSLWRLGVFNNETGQLDNETNECLWTATEAISQSQTIDPTQMELLNAQFKEDGNGTDPRNKPPQTAE